MIKFTTKYINVISIIISIVVVVFLNKYNFYNQKINSEEVLSYNQKHLQINQENFNNPNSINTAQEQKETNISNVKNQETNDLSNTPVIPSTQWKIEIPAIDLKAEIAEGTSKEIMDKYVGHFEETEKESGNIGLAAHNRGYKVNYFQNLKNLKDGDEIIYTYNGKQRKYAVKLQKIISDEDWSLLENTKENKITLITCVENQPEYRRCIQAIEI